MENFDQNSIISRIKQLRISFAGARGKKLFAEALGLSPSTYNYYEQDRLPPVETLFNICKITGADLYWVLTGESTPGMLARPASAGANPIVPGITDLLIKHPDMAEPISAFIELLCEKKGLESPTAPKPPSNRKPGWIPVLGRTAAGIVHCWDETSIPESAQAVTALDSLVKEHTGKDIVGTCEVPLSIDIESVEATRDFSNSSVNLIRVRSEQYEGIVEFLECEEIYNAFPDSFALHVDGDSMSPRIKDGDIVIASPSLPASQGQIAIVRVANQIGVTCKLLRISPKGLHLVPINEQYETKIILQKDLEWALGVLCHVNLNNPK